MQNSMMMTFIFTLFLSCIGVAASPSAPKKPTVAPVEKKPAAKKVDAKLLKLADAIQKQYNLTKTATFRFKQTYENPLLTAPDKNNSSGNVSYNKTSGNMMWDYQEPKNRQKKFYINGNQLTVYSVNDKNAFINNCYKRETLEGAVAFLLGTGNLKDLFTIEPYEGQDPKATLSWLTLIPKEPNSPVKKISLKAAKDGKVLESIVEDPSGGKNHFTFIDFKLNPKIPDSVFVFKRPDDVRVQPMPNVQCDEQEHAKQKPVIPAKKK